MTIDVSVEAGRISAVRLRGDFFVHPEPRTEDVVRSVETALTGLPADLGEAALAAHVAAAVPFGTELVGTTAGAIAVAVRRAVTGNVNLGSPPDLARVGSLTPERLAAILAPWRTIPWRLLPEVSFSPALNVALDEVLTNRVASGQSPPTLRFWRWSAPAVIVGRCQSVANEVDRDSAAALGVTVVRRMTGGGAMFLQPHGAITYSLYLPESAVAGLSIRESYEACESWVIDGLRSLGVDAHHVPINDIACSAGKIGGAAQARRAGVVLHHTTMAYDMDLGEMVKVLRVGREKLRDKAVTSAQKRVSPLVSQTGRPRDEIVAQLSDAFQSRFGGTLSSVTHDERVAGERLVAEKYGTAAWTDAFA